MNKHLRSLFRKERLRQGIRLSELAAQVGYKNVNRGCNRILRFEREGVITEDLFQKLVNALDIQPDQIEEAVERDLEEWRKWIEQPVAPELILKPIPGVYLTEPIPESLQTEEEFIAYARKVTKEIGVEACLALSRKESLWFGRDGELRFKSNARPGVPNIPYMTVGGSRRFLFRSDQ